MRTQTLTGPLLLCLLGACTAVPGHEPGTTYLSAERPSTVETDVAEGLDPDSEDAYPMLRYISPGVRRLIDHQDY